MGVDGAFYLGFNNRLLCWVSSGNYLFGVIILSDQRLKLIIIVTLIV